MASFRKSTAFYQPDLGGLSRKRASAVSKSCFVGRRGPFSLFEGKAVHRDRSPVMGKPTAHWPNHLDDPRPHNSPMWRRASICIFPAAGRIFGSIYSPHRAWGGSSVLTKFPMAVSCDPQNSGSRRWSFSATNREAAVVSLGSGIPDAIGKGCFTSLLYALHG